MTMMDERLNELIESLDAILCDIAQAGCHFVVAVVRPDLTSSRVWRTRNALVTYSLAEMLADETHNELVAGVGDEE